MANIVSRLFSALVLYGVGLFWAGVTVPVAVSMALVRSKFNLNQVFGKKKRNNIPRIAFDGYDHDNVRTKSGMKFHYVHAGDENNPLMLCLHGFPECWYSWKHVLKQFSSKYHVVAVDMRGYGQSDKPKSISKYHVTYLVNDVQEIISALGYQQAVIVAHDWGAAIAWAVPLYFPEVVSKLIILNVPNQKGLQEFTRSHPSQLLKSWYMFFFQLPWLAEFVMGLGDFSSFSGTFKGKVGRRGLLNPAAIFSDDEIELMKYYVCSDITYPINYYRALNPIYKGLDIKPVTKQVVQPTLFIWGKEDAFLDYRMIPYCEKYVRNIKTVLIEGASHWVGLDAPEKVRDAMEEFLKDE